MSDRPVLVELLAEVRRLSGEVRELRAVVAGRERPSGDLVTAAKLAELLGVRREYIYANADRLGAVRLGTGPRARLRFDPAGAVARHAELREPGGAAEPVRTVVRLSAPAEFPPIRAPRGKAA